MSSSQASDFHRHDPPRIFFNMLDILCRHRAALTYLGGFPEIPGVRTPPEQIMLTVTLPAGESITLLTLFDGDLQSDPTACFSEIREIIDHEGARQPSDGFIEIQLECDSPAFSDAIRILGYDTIRFAIEDRAMLRDAFAAFFRKQAERTPNDPSWQAAANRLNASAWHAVMEMFGQLPASD